MKAIQFKVVTFLVHSALLSLVARLRCQTQAKPVRKSVCVELVHRDIELSPFRLRAWGEHGDKAMYHEQ